MNAVAQNLETNMGIGIKYSFPSQKVVSLANFYMKRMEAFCKITESDNESPLSFTMSKGSGTFNGNSIATGDSVTVVFHPNDNFSLVAPLGAKVDFLNKGVKTLVAVCNVVTE